MDYHLLDIMTIENVADYLWVPVSSLYKLSQRRSFQGLKLAISS
jgi:hypothetical protein